MKKFISILFFIIVISCCSVNVFAEDSSYVASFDGEVPLYISPSTDSYAVISIPACSEVKKLEEKQTWILVEYENKAGWINSFFIKSGYEKAAEATGTDSEKFLQAKSESGVVKLYNLPYNKKIPSDAESFLVPNGTVLEQKRETVSGWGLVAVNEDYMWIKLEDTVEYQVYDNVVVDEKYFVYSLSSDGNGIKMWESDKKSEVRATIPDCTRLAVMEKSGEFIRVTYDGKEGWIESSDTEISLYNAQIKSGEAIGKTYEVALKNGKSVNMYYSPSEGTDENIVGTVDDKTTVFVLRQNQAGWSLVFHKGLQGWMKSECLKRIKNKETDGISMLETSKVGFVATKQSKGLEVCAKSDGSQKIAHIPETMKVEIIAKKGNYNYVICDYASGWAKNVRVVNTREEATKTNSLSKPESYDIEKDSLLMSLPADEKVAGCRNLCVVPKGESVMLQRVVETQNCEWALIEYAGETGWIKIKEPPNAAMIVAIVLSAVGVIILVIIFIVMRKKKLKGKTMAETLLQCENDKNKDSDATAEPAEKADIHNEETDDIPVK